MRLGERGTPFRVKIQEMGVGDLKERLAMRHGWRRRFNLRLELFVKSFRRGGWTSLGLMDRDNGRVVEGYLRGKGEYEIVVHGLWMG